MRFKNIALELRKLKKKIKLNVSDSGGKQGIKVCRPFKTIFLLSIYQSNINCLESKKLDMELKGIRNQNRKLYFTFNSNYSIMLR